MSKLLPNFQFFLVFVFLSLIIFTLDSFKILDIPKRSLFYITNPISFGIYRSYQNIRNQFHFMFASRTAAQESKALKEQLAQLLSENANLRKNLLETQSLVDQYSTLDPRTYNLIPARPIGIQRYLKIDQGSSVGIRLGQAAVFKDNYIGKIVEVESNSSNIQILADPDSKVAAFSQGLMGKARGVLLGQFGTDTLMDKILHEEKIEVGDLVYSEGTEGFLPRGLVLGRVTEVLERENEIFKQAKVKPVFEIRDLELIFVIGE